MKQTISTRRIAMAGVLAALTCAGSAIRITVPVELAGTSSIHLGNILCALSGILLGPWLGAAAAGMGSAIYDMLNPLYISEAWITFLFKGAYALAAGLVIRMGKSEWSYLRAVLASAAGAATYAFLYLAKTYFYNGMLLGGLTADAAWLAVLGKVPATVFNAAVAVVFAPVLAVAVSKALKQNHISLDH